MLSHKEETCVSCWTLLSDRRGDVPKGSEIPLSPPLNSQATNLAFNSHHVCGGDESVAFVISSTQLPETVSCSVSASGFRP